MLASHIVQLMYMKEGQFHIEGITDIEITTTPVNENYLYFLKFLKWIAKFNGKEIEWKLYTQ